MIHSERPEILKRCVNARLLSCDRAGICAGLSPDSFLKPYNPLETQRLPLYS